MINDYELTEAALQAEIAKRLPPGAVICEEWLDEQEEPPEEEIMELAERLGMDPIHDKKYFYIAREALLAPLPIIWKPYKTREGETFYINIETGESVAEHPCDLYYSELFQKEKLKARKQKEESILIKENAHKQEQSQSAKKIIPKPHNKLTNENDPFLLNHRQKKLENYKRKMEQQLIDEELRLKKAVTERLEFYAQQNEEQKRQILQQQVRTETPSGLGHSSDIDIEQDLQKLETELYQRNDKLINEQKEQLEFQLQGRKRQNNMIQEESKKQEEDRLKQIEEYRNEKLRQLRLEQTDIQRDHDTQIAQFQAEQAKQTQEAMQKLEDSDHFELSDMEKQEIQGEANEHLQTEKTLLQLESDKLLKQQCAAVKEKFNALTNQEIAEKEKQIRTLKSEVAELRKNQSELVEEMQWTKIEEEIEFEQSMESLERESQKHTELAQSYMYYTGETGSDPSETQQQCETLKSLLKAVKDRLSSQEDQRDKSKEILRMLRRKLADTIRQKEQQQKGEELLQQEEQLKKELRIQQLQHNVRA